MHKASYKLSLKLINTTKLKKMMYTCINKSYKIYIMQLLTRKVTKIQTKNTKEILEMRACIYLIVRENGVYVEKKLSQLC